LFSDDALRETMTTRRYRWFNPVQWFTSAGRVDEDAMAGDVFRLRRLYADAGYLDTEVSGPELVPAGRRRVDAVYRVREGRQYTLSGVRVSGAEKIPSAELERVLRVRPGQLASRNQIDDAAGVLLDYYGNRGYVRTSVDPVIDPDAKAGQADLTFRIREGEVARIRDIRILGNVQTHDKVIRRELVVEPGQIFHRSRIRSSERRLMNLGYFATVFSFPEPTADPAYNDLVFQVEEQRMGQANVGAGFSSIDSFTTIFELSHGNMDLTGWPPVGAGQKLRLRGTLGTRRTDVSLSFIEPYFLDRRLSLGTDLFRSDLRFESNDYNIRRTGGEVSLTHPLGRFNRIRGAYGLEEVSVYDVEDTASPIIRAEEGDRLKSSLSMSLSHESRDQLWAPTRGNTSRLMTGVAGGPLGADVDWYRAEFQTAQYIPVASNHVLLLRGRIAGIREFGDSDSVPIFDRLFLGGPLNVRAFKYREVGPVDEEEEPVGGRALAFASAEYLIRLGRMVRLSAYVDGGQVWSDAFSYDLRWNSGYGFGVYIDLPMLPLKFFYAWPIDAEEYNQHDGGVFSFLMGHAF
jgi:outer membrane protein insertion porin family